MVTADFRESRVIPDSTAGTAFQTYLAAPSPASDRVVALNGEVMEIDPDQAWFWAPDWQAGEHRVEDYIREGNVQTFDTMEEFMQTLRD